MIQYFDSRTGTKECDLCLESCGGDCDSDHARGDYGFRKSNYAGKAVDDVPKEGTAVNQAQPSLKKVLMVHNFYQIGGGEHTVFANEEALLKNHGHEVVKYTRSNDELKTSKWKLLLSPFSTVWSWKTYREVKRVIRSEHIDIVHCHNTFPLISPSVYYAARACGIPVVQTIHNFRFLCPNGVFYCQGRNCEKCREKKSFRDALRNCCYRDSKVQTMIVVAMLKVHRMLGTYRKINYIFLTEFNKSKFSDLIDINGSNVFIKPNFVLPEDARNEDGKSGSTQRPGRQGSRKTFVFVGRLDENKGILLLLKAWASLPETYDLRILGNGSCEEQVKEAASKHGNITYLGFQRHECALEEMRRADAMVFPGLLYEGFPMTISESFSVGCPVISTNIGNQASLVQASGGGELFDPAEEESLKKAVERVLADREQYVRKALAYYESVLTPEENYKRLMDIYDSAQCIR